MTDAVTGELGGYVPCGGVSATIGLADDTAAVFGEGEGYVPVNTAAGSAPGSLDDTAAVYGSTAGFVAPPCEVNCHGPDGQITDTFNRPAESDGWGIGTGGYEEGGFGPTEYTTGTAGALDTYPIVFGPPLYRGIHAGPAGPVGLGDPAPHLLDISASFSSDIDMDDWTPDWQAFDASTDAIHDGVWGAGVLRLGDTNSVSIGLQGSTGAVLHINFAHAGIVEDHPITFIAGSPTTIRVALTPTTFEVDYGGVAISTHTGTYTGFDSVAPVFRAGGRTPTLDDIEGTYHPPNGGRQDVRTLIDWIEIVGYPPCP